MIIYRPHRLVLSLDQREPTYVVPNDAVVDYLERGRYNELPEQRLIQWALTQLMSPDRVFVDAGAHIGTWTLQFAASDSVRAVEAFEPQGDMFTALQAAVGLNGVASKVNLHQTALGSAEQAGAGILRLKDSDGLGASILALPLNATVTNYELVTVQTLDACTIHEIGLLKLDVEGNELEVLRGATATLENSHWPLIIFEAWDVDWYAVQKQATFDYLETLGYRIVPIRTYTDVFLAEHHR